MTGAMGAMLPLVGATKRHGGHADDDTSDEKEQGTLHRAAWYGHVRAWISQRAGQPSRDTGEVARASCAARIAIRRRRLFSSSFSPNRRSLTFTKMHPRTSIVRFHTHRGSQNAGRPWSGPPSLLGQFLISPGGFLTPLVPFRRSRMRCGILPARKYDSLGPRPRPRCFEAAVKHQMTHLEGPMTRLWPGVLTEVIE